MHGDSGGPYGGVRGPSGPWGTFATLAGGWAEAGGTPLVQLSPYPPTRPLWVRRRAYDRHSMTATVPTTATTASAITAISIKAPETCAAPPPQPFRRHEDSACAEATDIG